MRAVRNECTNILNMLHQRRHGIEQRMLERVLQDWLCVGDKIVEHTYENLLTYWELIPDR